MRPARPTARVLACALLAASPVRAQEPVQAYTPAPRYSTFHLGAQVTGDVDRGRDILFSWGRMRAMGGRGEWMPRLELAAGVTSGRDLLDGIVAGPSVGMGYALPAQHLDFGRRTRADPYLVAQASVYGIGRFRGRMESDEAGQEDGWGIAPAVSAGIGLRMFGDEWDVDLSTLEIVVEKRLGFGEDDPQIFVRFGRALAPRERRRNGDGPTIAPAAHLPPPPDTRR